MKKSVLAIIGIFLSSQLYASASLEAKVIRVGKYGDGKLMIVLDTEISELNCASPRIDVPNTHPNIDYFLSIALAAAASDTTVKVVTNGCLGSYPTLDQTDSSLFYFKKG